MKVKIYSRVLTYSDGRQEVETVSLDPFAPDLMDLGRGGNTGDIDGVRVIPHEIDVPTDGNVATNEIAAIASLSEPGWRVEMQYQESCDSAYAQTRRMTLGEAIAVVRTFRKFEGYIWPVLLPPSVEDEDEATDGAGQPGSPAGVAA
jgi:hypothetical protein